MTTLALKPRKAKIKPYNKKQAMLDFVKQYKIPFDMKDDAIDLREMGKNYDHDLIPLEDINRAILAVIGPRYVLNKAPYDPSGGATIVYPPTANSIINRFGYVSWDQLYLWPIFQRDVAPNHVEKIVKDFDPTAVIVPCAIRMTLKEGKNKGCTIFCLWDGHHTVQVCRLEGYTHFPVWYIDIDLIPDAEVIKAGFAPNDQGRIAYGAFIAGTNMRRINGKNKRPLSPYDDFMIGYDTRDSQYTSMMNILRKNDCRPKRHATCSGAFTQIKSGIECYELVDANGVKGQFWDRALRLHRKHWPAAPLTLEIFRPLSYLFQWAHIEGFTLPPSFDDELAGMLIAWKGDAESIQESIKDSFWSAYTTSSIRGVIPDHDKDRVLNGLINFYVQHGGKTLLPTPHCQWIV
jgi:hypothetical protein